MSVAAHLIIGKRAEPFLAATLASLEGVVDRLLVNDNSGDPDSANARVLAASAFATSDRLFIDDAPFVNFSDARNRVLALHRRHNAGAWAAFIDADEVHRPIAARIARTLDTLPASVAMVDGYTRHYVQSFNWYTTIERRLSFFRVTPELRWERPVHEKLEGVTGSTLVLPYVYDHYGMVLPMLHYADKGRRYSSLGQAGTTYTDAELTGEDPIHFFRDFWPLALRYDGTHPTSVLPVRAEIAHQNPGYSARVDSAIRAVQTPGVRASNVARRINFEYRWRARMLDPRARRVMDTR